jgi:hypothetical protein
VTGGSTTVVVVVDDVEVVDVVLVLGGPVVR